MQRRAADSGSGKRAAFEDIIAAEQAILLRTARRMCQGSRDRAEDLVQEALINGYRAYLDGRFQDGTNSRAWLLKILTNVFLNDCKRRRREAQVVDAHATDRAAGQTIESLPAPRGEEPDAFLDSALDEPVEQALRALSDEFRACVVLVDVEGLEYADAAAALGVPIGTVRSRLARARLQLHGLLYDYARERRRAPP